MANPPVMTWSSLDTCCSSTGGKTATSSGCAVDAGKCRRIPPIGAGTYASTGGTVESGGTSYPATAIAKQMIVDHLAGIVSVSYVGEPAVNRRSPAHEASAVMPARVRRAARARPRRR
jgi:hypothetical protein